MSARSSDEVSLSGYLYKKTRDGRWQKRWFETSGVYLTYYKSKKMEKLLAALSLPQVGGIRIISADEDPEKIEGDMHELSDVCFVELIASNIMIGGDRFEIPIIFK